MSPVIIDLIGRLELGEPASEGGLTIFPVFGRSPAAPAFVTLQEALAARSLAVTEVSEGGAVPMLKAHNRGEVGVLILDGEELAGAKQNRVLNTTVYIRPGQEIVIPVSCTEAGRWSYRTQAFDDSGYVAALGIRMEASRSVTLNVRASGHYVSDQGRVWEEVAELQKRHRTSSATSAARDVYEQKDEHMRRRQAAFRCLPGQTGILALWSGRVAGLDFVASDTAFAKLHGRLVRSYALDAPSGARPAVAHDVRVAEEWLQEVGRAQTTEHESPGAGISYRLSGTGVVGAALAVDGALLHAAAFATQKAAGGLDGTDDTDGANGADAGERHYPGFFVRRAHFPW